MKYYIVKGTENPENTRMTNDVSGDHFTTRENYLDSCPNPPIEKSEAEETAGEDPRASNLRAAIQHHL